MLKKIFLYSSGVFLLFVAYQLLYSPRPMCVLEKSKFTLDTVRTGKFEEIIPLSGYVIHEDASWKVVADIDELYWQNVSVGLNAISTVNGRDYSLTLTHKDSVLRDGRFKVTFSSADSVWQMLEEGRRRQPTDVVFRMGLHLSEIADATQIRVGGFYRDTGGKYIYVVLNDGKIVKRNIVLGKKNPEYFQVLAGLVPGDVVINSSYENLHDIDDLDLETLRELND
jgi:hypothetical protein